VIIAVSNNLVYALNGLDTGSVSGFSINGRQLRPLAGSTRSLNLVPPSGSSSFVQAPGQVGFTPDGKQLIVTTKANTNGNTIEVFNVDAAGQLSSTPALNPPQLASPFAFTFCPRGLLVGGEVGTSNVSAYSIDRTGHATPIGTVAAGADMEGIVAL
jgi:hypothetical protein